MKQPLLIYVVEKTNRVAYIFPILFNALGINNLKITTNTEQFKFHRGPKINYSNSRFTNEEYWVKPVRLLFEKTIQEQLIHCFKWKDEKAFFKTEGCDFPFDIFAASFYLITRYEEYLPHNKDLYGRYAHENSIAFKEGFLQLPLANMWIKEFGIEPSRITAVGNGYSLFAKSEVEILSRIEARLTSSVAARNIELWLVPKNELKPVLKTILKR